MSAVYELREAAVEHGKALVAAERTAAPEARDHLLATTLDVEKKTAAVLDECADNTLDAVEEALERSA